MVSGDAGGGAKDMDDLIGRECAREAGAMSRFSVGLDLGSQQVALAVYDHSKQCSIPLEIGGDKTMPACVAFDQSDVIVGKRAEGRSAKKCEGVLCAHRQMLYGMEEEWRSHRSMCNQQWHFNVGTLQEADNRDSKSPGIAYMVKGSPVQIAQVLGELVRVVCATLQEATAPGGVLQCPEGADIRWENFAVAVPECLTAMQRSHISDALRSSVEVLADGVKLVLVNEPLALAMQFCSIPPFAPKSFMSVDFGASKLTVSLYSLDQVGERGGRGDEEDDESAARRPVVYSLKEVGSRTNVFVSASEVEYRMIQWVSRGWDETRGVRSGVA